MSCGPGRPDHDLQRMARFVRRVRRLHVTVSSACCRDRTRWSMRWWGRVLSLCAAVLLVAGCDLRPVTDQVSAIDTFAAPTAAEGSGQAPEDAIPHVVAEPIEAELSEALADVQVPGENRNEHRSHADPPVAATPSPPASPTAAGPPGRPPPGLTTTVGRPRRRTPGRRPPGGTPPDRRPRSPRRLSRLRRRNPSTCRMRTHRPPGRRHPPRRRGSAGRRPRPPCRCRRSSVRSPTCSTPSARPPACGPCASTHG